MWVIRCRTRDNSSSFTLYKATLEEVRVFCRSLTRGSSITAIERPDGTDGWADAFCVRLSP